MNHLKGMDVAKRIAAEITEKITSLYEKNVVPTLAIVRVGDNSGDIAYENGAIKRAKALGMQVEKFTCEKDIAEDDLISVIEFINSDSKIHGILLLQPLPPEINGDKVRNAICKEKDVDCISDESLADFFIKEDYNFAPCTAESAMRILEYYGINPEGKKAVVIGRSMVIGRPVALMLMRKNASVTVCHSRTPEDVLIEYCKDADIIVTAAGKINTVTCMHLSGQQIIIDVGINFTEDGKMVGDVDFESIESKNAAKGVTPVPGGVGSVTNTVLMNHLLRATLNQTK